MTDLETEPKLCFLIGPIGAEGSETRRDADFLLEYVVRPVLEDEPYFYRVKRADKDVSPGSINSAVINDIIKADLAIADLSENNANAFYELGIRHHAQKPVIHMSRDVAAIPFDLHDQRALSFSTSTVGAIERAKRDLSAAVEYVISDKFKVSNPVTMAVGFNKLQVDGDSRDQILTVISQEVSTLGHQLERTMAKVDAIVGATLNKTLLPVKDDTNVYTENMLAPSVDTDHKVKRIRRYIIERPAM